MKVEGKVAIVVGGARGFGRANVELLLAKGAKVMIGDILEDIGDKAVDELLEKNNGCIAFKKCDVTDEDSINELFRHTAAEWQQAPEILINTAGILNETKWKAMVQINMVGTINTTYAAMEHMNPANGGNGGVVIQTASISAFLGSKYHPVYVSTKHAVLGLTFSLGQPAHLERTGVRVNCVCPTNAFTDLVKDMESYFQDEYLYMKKHKFGSITPEAVAEAMYQLIINDERNGDAMVVTGKKGTFLHDKSREDFYTTCC